MRRRLMLKTSAGVSPVLPVEYQECEWVGVSNNIEDRVILIYGNILSKAELSDYVLSFTMGNITDTYDADSQQVGIVCGTSGNAGCYFCSKSKLLGMGYRYIGQYLSTPKREYEMRWTATGGTVYSGGNVITTRNFTNMTGDQQFKIGCASTNNPPVSFECYKAKITHHNAVVADLIPCYRKSDGVIGFYDVIGNIFRYNQNGYYNFNAKGADV